MSAFDFLLPWEQQPWEPAGIDWDHPRAEGLCFFMPGGDALGMVDLVRGQPLTLTGLVAGVSTKQGTSRLFGTSSYADFTPPPEIGANTPFSVSWTQEARSTSGYSTVLSVNFGTAGTHYQFVIYQGTAADAYRFSAGPRRSSGAHSWATTIGAVTNNRLDRFVLRAAAGSQSTTSSDFTLWRNGVLIAQDTTTAFSINQTAGARIGARSDGGGDPWEGAILDMRLWARVLSDDESAEESQVQPAAALYTPRRIWVPVSAAGGTASITAADGAATTSTLGGSSTAATTVTQAAGAAIASSFTGSSIAVASFTQADGVASASTLVGSDAGSGTTDATITAADGAATASTLTGAATAAASITQANGAATTSALVGADASTPSSITAAAGTATTGTLEGVDATARSGGARLRHITPAEVWVRGVRARASVAAVEARGETVLPPAPPLPYAPVVLESVAPVAPAPQPVVVSATARVRRVIARARLARVLLRTASSATTSCSRARVAARLVDAAGCGFVEPAVRRVRAQLGHAVGRGVLNPTEHELRVIARELLAVSRQRK